MVALVSTVASIHDKKSEHGRKSSKPACLTRIFQLFLNRGGDFVCLLPCVFREGVVFVRIVFRLDGQPFKFSKIGQKLKILSILEMDANDVMPISGEKRNNRSGRGRPGSDMASRAYLTARAPPLEYPAITNGESLPIRFRTWRAPIRLAATQSSHRTFVKALGTVPWAGKRSPRT
jgi:hypothetical protein